MPEYRNKHIAINLSKLGIDYAKQHDFDYVISMAHPENIASCNSLQKAGFCYYDTKVVKSNFLRNLYFLKLR